jgi:ADP-ribosylglycohydrolase
MFELDKGCYLCEATNMALISDDTQMTLFTANGLLMGLTRGYMRGIGGRPEKYVDGAYIDWYYTQTGKKRDIAADDWHYTWLRDISELSSRRAPGNTCLIACESLLRGEKVVNNSKGCGGIMRVAPVALYAAARGDFDDVAVAQLAADAAECTHQHPLGYLPASLFAVLLYKIVSMPAEQVREEIDNIVEDTINVLDCIYKDKHESDKSYLRELTEKAMQLAHSDLSDADAIRQLGEGWVAEETWAIALYCAVRHIDSVKDAIIASVNHDGDSDSTGSVCGNIMGAIYGYEHIKERNIFCPEGKILEDTLELSEVILALADDLSSGSKVSEHGPVDTPEKRQWYERYYKMQPAGIGDK